MTGPSGPRDVDDDRRDEETLDETFFLRARAGLPPGPSRVTAWLDHDVIAALRARHPEDWQSRISGLLRRALGL